MVMPCHAMRMAASASQNSQPLDEAAAKRLVEKLLRKKHTDVVTELGKFSDEQKEFIKGVLHKSPSLFTPKIRLQQVLSGHANYIQSVSFSPDGTCALTVSSDHTARLWDLTKSTFTSKEPIVLAHCVISYAFSLDGRFALTGSCDGNARLWDLTKSPISCLELKRHTNQITASHLVTTAHLP